MSDVVDLSQAFEDQGTDSLELEFECHDCRCSVRVIATKDEQGIVFAPQGGARGYYPELNSGQREYFVKCKECFEKDEVLRRFNPTEVYTRVVGYYRPVQAWNVGKKAEYANRQNFSQPDEGGK